MPKITSRRIMEAGCVIVLYLQPVLDPKSYDGDRMCEANNDKRHSGVLPLFQKLPEMCWLGGFPGVELLRPIVMPGGG